MNDIFEYWDGGDRMYLINGRKYFADQYDKMYKPDHGIKIMNRNKKWKGENPDRTKNWMKGLKSY